MRRWILFTIGLLCLIAGPLIALKCGQPSHAATLEFLVGTGEPDRYRIEIEPVEEGRLFPHPVKLRVQSRKHYGTPTVILLSDESEWSEPFYVPEPGFYVLLITGLIGLGILNSIRSKTRKVDSDERRTHQSNSEAIPSEKIR